MHRAPEGGGYRFGLHKILVGLFGGCALVNTIFGIQHLMHCTPPVVYCNRYCAIYGFPPPLLFCHSTYNIANDNFVYRPNRDAHQ